MLNLYKLPELKFPDNFIFGSATAGHQIEGNNNNSQRYFMELRDPIKHEDPSGMACNNYELYREDIKLLQDLKHQGYRFSIEWSRIQPSCGEFSQKELDHYLDQLTLLKEANIHTSVTLYHFTHPQWFELLGGFSKEENLSCWRAYLEYLVPKIAHLVDSWCVLNEFNLGGDGDIPLKICQLKAHGYGYQIIKAHSSAPVSSAHAFVHRSPKRPNDPMDNAFASYLDWVDNEFFFHAIRTGEIVMPYRDVEYMPELKGSCDYWAINFYNRAIVDSRTKIGRGRAFNFSRFCMIDGNFYKEEFTPESLITNLSRLRDLPIMITENGICANDDRFRIISLTMHLAALLEAAKLYSLDIRGYFHWSLFDNYEWTSFKPRFGMVDVDFETFKRTPKPSALFYKKIIENNGLSGKLFSEFLPELPELLLYDVE